MGEIADQVRAAAAVHVLTGADYVALLARLRRAIAERKWHAAYGAADDLDELMEEKTEGK